VARNILEAAVGLCTPNEVTVTPALGRDIAKSHTDMPTQPDITRRLLGSSAIVRQEPGAREISVQLDVEGLVRRLLLFDTYILYSVRLKEIAGLIQRFGYEGTLTLLSSGALEIRCECIQFAEGQFSTPACPPLTFQFHVVDAANRDQYLIDNLSEVNRVPGLSSSELMALRTAVMKAIRQPDIRGIFRSDVAPAFENDILNRPSFLKAAVRQVLEKEKGVVAPEDFTLKFHKVGDDRYEAETDLAQKLPICIDDLHRVLKVAMLGVSSVDQRLGEMRVHNALSGFIPEEVPLFRSKLESLLEAFGSQSQERRFQRVITLAGLPEIPPDSRVDVNRLLKIRSEPEALEFKGWLAGTDKLSAAELQQLVTSMNVKLGLAAQTVTGKAIRFLVSTVSGIVAPILGIAVGALDQFAWDKFARRSGVAAFVHELYPSVFTTAIEDRKRKFPT
jgi:hypothetical protein